MVTERFLLGRGRHLLGADDLAALEHAVRERREVPARQHIIRRGEVVNNSTLLIEGFLCRYMDDREGHRQIVALHIPGDFVDLHAFPMKRLDHDIASLTPAKLALVDHRTLSTLTANRPVLTRMLWYSTLLDAAMHREWIFRIGRLGAEGRIAHLMSEMHERMRLVGLAQQDRFPLPILQTDIAEAVGLTPVHVNRTLRSLREDGIITLRKGVAEIHDMTRLHRMAEFNPDYLYADWSKEMEVL